MKALIWIGCLFGASLVGAIFTTFIGRPGFIVTILLYLPAFGIARALCKSWEVHQMEKESSNKPDDLFEKLQEVKKEDDKKD